LLFASVRNQRLGVRAHQYIAIGTPLVANGTLVNLLARYLIPRITTSNIPPLDQRPFVDLNAPFIYLFHAIPMVYFTTNVLSFSTRYTFPKQGEMHDYKKYYTLKSAFHPMIKNNNFSQHPLHVCR
jgi:hypothetical protein